MATDHVLWRSISMRILCPGRGKILTLIMGLETGKYLQIYYLKFTLGYANNGQCISECILLLVLFKPCKLTSIG